MKQIGFQYSNDGSTWSTALVIGCLNVDVYKITESDLEKAADASKAEKPTSYINVDIETDWTPFDPAQTAAAEANWLYIQEFCAASRRRIYNGDTTNWPTLDEFDTFNSSSNTVYVNLLDMEPAKPSKMDQFGANTLKVRVMRMNLQTKAAQ